MTIDKNIHSWSIDYTPTSTYCVGGGTHARYEINRHSYRLILYYIIFKRANTCDDNLLIGEKVVVAGTPLRLPVPGCDFLSSSTRSMGNGRCDMVTTRNVAEVKS